FPLHVWLPDAMAGPTSVSALIHAATLVAAGVYLVARAYGIFAPSPTALTTVAWVGGITAIFAASIALVMADIKKVLAYSTVSQLGFMMVALGVGGYTAGIFHLLTHAVFKALLFLAWAASSTVWIPKTCTRWAVYTRRCPSPSGRGPLGRERWPASIHWRVFGARTKFSWLPMRVVTRLSFGSW